MIKINCYHTTQEKLLKAFCNLTERCYYNGVRVFVYATTEKEVVELDTALWTYNKRQFIPHGTIYDIYPDEQPILIGCNLEIVNSPSSIIIINPDRKNILAAILAIKKLNSNECKRLFILYGDNSSLSNEEIKSLIIRSLPYYSELNFYIQNVNSLWCIQKIG